MHGQYTSGILLVLALYRILTWDAFIELIIKRYLPEPILFANSSGKRSGVGYNWYNKEEGRTLDHDFRRNMCAWNLIFQDPLLAVTRLSKTLSGKMTANQLNYFISIGKVIVVTDEGVRMNNPDNGAPVIYLSGDHASAIGDVDWKSMKRLTTPYSGDSIGYLIPKPRPTEPRKHRKISQMDEHIEWFEEIIKSDRVDAAKAIAEFAVLSLLEEKDCMQYQLSNPVPESCTQADLRNAFLTDTGTNIYSIKNGCWLTRAGYSIKDKHGYILKDMLPDAEGEMLCFDGYQWFYADWSSGYPKGFYTIDEFVDRVNQKKTAYSPRNYLVVMKRYPYRRGALIAKRAKAVLSQPLHDYKKGQMAGPPSCGKTTTIMKLLGLAFEAFEDSEGIVVGREGKRPYKLKGFDVRTLDSILVNGHEGGPLHTIYLDEGLKTHAGAVEMLGQIMRPSVLKVFGDRHQIGWINRVNGYEAKYAKHIFDLPVDYYPNAYQTPKCVVDLLAPVYKDDGGYIWANKTHGSLNMREISDHTQIGTQHTLVLTYLQGDKTKLQQAHPEWKVLTVDEAQGLRAESVALVRLTHTEMDIFNCPKQSLVAMTRTWKDFTYYTVKPSGIMFDWLTGVPILNTNEEFEIDELKKFRAVEYKSSGGCYTPRHTKSMKFVELEESKECEQFRSNIMKVMPMEYTRALPFLELVTKPQKCRLSVNMPPKPSVQVVQSALDEIFNRRNEPEKGKESRRIVSDIPDGVYVDLTKFAKLGKVEPRKALHPRLVTPQPERAQSHQNDVMIALMKRVLGDTNIKKGVGTDQVGKALQRFCEICDMDKLEKLNQTMPIGQVHGYVRWWNTRGGRRLLKLKDVEIHKIKGQMYYIHVRGDHKCNVGRHPKDGLEEGQLITASDEFITAMFAPMFQTMLVKLRLILPDHIILNTHQTYEQLNDMIDSLLSGAKFKSIELDVSKYDKSQDRNILIIQCEIFIMLGMPEWAVELWRSFHESTILKDPKFGIKANVGYQRRSGDALTWLGNTLVLLVIMAYLYPIEKAFLVLLSGDDNVTAFHPDVEIKDESKTAAAELNMEIKTLSLSDSMYFCSRYIVLTSKGWMTVGDPVKIVCRMGRNDLQGTEHIQEIHNSYSSLYYSLRDGEVRVAVEKAALARIEFMFTRKLLSLRHIMNAATWIVSDVNYMKTLFTGTKSEWDLKLDPNEKVGGGRYDRVIDLYEDYDIL
jgi:hypothetical protein